MHVGGQRHEAGHVVPEHVHNPVKRSTVGTMETLLVLSGMVEVGVGRDSVRLGAGDAVVIYPGVRHSMRVLHEATIFETKSGPYWGRESDKTDVGPVPGAGAGA